MLPGLAPCIAAIEVDTSDPYFANVELLMHMLGTNGQTTFPQTQDPGKVVSFSRESTNLQITTSEGLFGSSAYFDGNDWLRNGSSSKWDVAASEDFTVELAFRLDTGTYGATTNEVSYIWFQSNASSGETNPLTIYKVLLSGVTNIRAAISSVNVVAPVNREQWYRISMSRLSNVVYVHLDGILIGSGAFSGAINVAGLGFGRNAFGSVGYFKGHIAEVRYTKGVGRYGASDYSVPSVPFPDA